jgi:hypothetical protein
VGGSGRSNEDGKRYVGFRIVTGSIGGSHVLEEEKEIDSSLDGNASVDVDVDVDVEGTTTTATSSTHPPQTVEFIDPHVSDGRTLCVRHQMMADQGVNGKLQKVGCWAGGFGKRAVLEDGGS